MKIIFLLIHALSRLPLRVLYIFADLIFFVNYYVIGYRKQVVLDNIKNSFPEKTLEEIQAIRKRFFRNFSDYIVETLKTFSVSETELRVRVQHINQDVFQEARNENKNVILLAGHVFNWEWYNALAPGLPQSHCHPVYRKMQNSLWDNEIRKIRSKFGNQPLEAGEVIRHIMRQPNDGSRIYLFAADQSPQMISHGIEFLNQKTPVFIGYDKLAMRLDLAFIYCDMKKVKRGFYQVNYYRILPDGEKFAEMEVVKKFHRLLENTIKKRADNYLWSHRKWKYAQSIQKQF